VAQLIARRLDAAPSVVEKASLDNLTKVRGAMATLSAQLVGPARGETLREIVASGCIEPERLSIQLDRAAVAQSLAIEPAEIKADALSIAGAFRLRRRGVEAKLVLDERLACHDPRLLKSLAQGWLWFQEIKAGTSMQAIARREGFSQRRVAHLLDLAFLAPDIVQSVIAGQQSPTLTADRLIRSRHRLLWDQQRAEFAQL